MKVILRIALTLIIILTSTLAYSAVIFVDRNLVSNCSGNYSIANRNCTGSNGYAYKTLAAGIGAIRSGDTLYVRSGTYYENSSTIPPLGNYASMVTISGYQNEVPVINNQNPSVDTITLDGQAGNVTFTKLKFIGARTAGGAHHIGNDSTSGIGIIVVDDVEFDGVSHAHLKGSWQWRVRNCIFKNWGTGMYQDHAIYRTGNASLSSINYPIFEYNYFENTKYGGSDIGGAIHIYSNTGTSIPKYDVVRYNVFKGSMVWGVLADGDYLKIYNNSAYGVYRFVEIQGNTGTEIYNNISANPTEPWGFVMCSGGCNNTVIKNNVTTLGNVYWNACNSCTISNNSLNTDPKLIGSVPSTWTDFRLATNSPCIDAGSNLGSSHQLGLNPIDTAWPPSTLNQNNYGGWEIGAFVFTNGDAPPSPPAGLKIIQ